MGIPLDPLAPALDISSEFFEAGIIFDPSPASLTLVLEDDRRTHPAGRSAIPQDFYCGARASYLIGERRAVEVRFLARWARLFRRGPLQRRAVVEFVASCQ